MAGLFSYVLGGGGGYRLLGDQGAREQILAACDEFIGCRWPAYVPVVLVRRFGRVWCAMGSDPHHEEVTRALHGALLDDYEARAIRYDPYAALLRHQKSNLSCVRVLPERPESAIPGPDAPWRVERDFAGGYLIWAERFCLGRNGFQLDRERDAWSLAPPGTVHLQTDRTWFCLEEKLSPRLATEDSLNRRAAVPLPDPGPRAPEAPAALGGASAPGLPGEPASPPPSAESPAGPPRFSEARQASPAPHSAAAGKSRWPPALIVGVALGLALVGTLFHGRENSRRIERLEQESEKFAAAAKIAALENRIGGLEKNLDELGGKLGNLNGDLARMRKDIAELELTLRERGNQRAGRNALESRDAGFDGMGDDAKTRIREPSIRETDP